MAFANESNWVTAFYQLLRVGDVPCDLEGSSSFGRYDIVFKVNQAVYIVEFKLVREQSSKTVLAGIAKKAIEQIVEKRYEQSAFVQRELEGTNRPLVRAALIASTAEKRYVLLMTQTEEGAYIPYYFEEKA
jgi:hypothetical protein